MQRLAVDLADVPSRPTLKVYLDGLSSRASNEPPLKVWEGIRIEAGLIFKPGPVKSFGMTAASSARQLLIKTPLKVLPASGSSASHLRMNMPVKSLGRENMPFEFIPEFAKKFLNSEEAGPHR